MKTVALTGIRAMQIINTPLPRIDKPTDVLLRVASIGVCGSDVHYYVTGKIGTQVVQYPYPVGHEFSAIVEKTGTGVKHLKPGDRVAVEPAMSCGDCDQCKAHRRHTCRALRFLGCPGQAPGCLSEYIVMPDACCFPIQSTTTLEQAAIAEPLSIGVYAVKLSGDIKGRTIGIFGSGPIGLSVLLAAAYQGAGSIYITDKLDQRLALAKKAGATWTGNPDKTDVVRDVTLAEPLLLDTVFDCCGKQEALDQSVQMLKPGGKLMLIGIPEIDRISFNIDTLRRREICIQNVRRQNECMQPAIDLIESRQVNVDFMITHRFRLDQTQEAFDLVAGYKDGVMKAMINVFDE